MIEKIRPNRVFRTYHGGRRIEGFCRTPAFPGGTFPEDWTASTVRARNPGRESIVEGYGVLESGKVVRDLFPEGKGLPILLKLLDSDERLVIQAHPTREFARKYMDSDVGKAECWYVLSAEEDACVYAGFRPGVTKEAWKEVFHVQDTEKMLSMLWRLPVKEGDFLFIGGGLPHAIGGGCLLCELQEPSDLMVVTERVTPAGRVLPDEKLCGRLGFDRMFDVFDYRNFGSEKELRAFLSPAPKRVLENVTEIIGKTTTDAFTMLKITGSASVPLKSRFGICIVTKGRACVNGTMLEKGDRALLYECGEGIFIPEESGFEALLCF